MKDFAMCFVSGFVKKCDRFCKRFCGQFLEAFCKDCSGFIIQTPSFYCEKHNRNDTPFFTKISRKFKNVIILKIFHIMRITQTSIDKDICRMCGFLFL